MLAALLAGLTLASSAQLPVGQHYSSLSLSTTGVPWVTAGRGLGRGAYGSVGADGKPGWHAVRGVKEWDGRLVTRPGGGMWVLADDHTVLRVASDGSAARFTFPTPNGQLGSSLVLAGLPDGSLIVTRALKRFLRIRPDGSSEAFPVGIFKADDCSPINMISRPDGTLAIADPDCYRVLTVGQNAPGDVFDLRNNEQPYGLLGQPDGSIWFTSAINGSEGAIGRIAPGGTITRFETGIDYPEAIAGSPDGSVYATIQGECRLFKVAGGKLTQVAAPLQAYDLRFAADGSVWLLGNSRLEHVTLPATGHCDTRFPTFTLPDVHDEKTPVSALSRGLRVHSNEDARLWGSLAIGRGRTIDVDQPVRRGQTVRVKLSAALRKRVKPDAEIDVLLTLTDTAGNSSEPPAPLVTITS